MGRVRAFALALFVCAMTGSIGGRNGVWIRYKGIAYSGVVISDVLIGYPLWACLGSIQRIGPMVIRGLYSWLHSLI